ncbi:uncharacterized protein VTP21DRAFT_4817 [Calcarisporiella thermophila]|uniref:uncharacterized protein n=1 Tax=Calcarisporiella thermophila TaxID=911321 RepID=UPI003742F5BB
MRLSIALIARRSYTTTPLSNSPVRVRFAPSPTGDLHLGGLRTALFNYLFARKHNGSFILRIEDTDRNRHVEGAIERLIKTLNWAGLEYDEGPSKGGAYGPYIQSQRLERYKAHANMLIENGAAYRCFCSPQRLQSLRSTAERKGIAHQYDKHCVHLSTTDIADRLARNDPFTIRLNVQPGVTRVQDLVYGTVEFSNKLIDDSILIKSDGYPTYHLANVVDDHQMNISHVIRGEEWLPSTPKHLLLYRAFGWKSPLFAHVPLLMNEGGGKLSKRMGHAHVEDFLGRGYFPEALINYVALLGWNPPVEDEFFTLPDLISHFSLDNITRSNAIVTPQKLDWLNKLHLLRKANDADERRELITALMLMVQQAGYSGIREQYVGQVLDSVKERIRKLRDVVDLCGYYFSPPKVRDESIRDAVGIKLVESITRQMLGYTYNAKNEEWNGQQLSEEIRKIAQTESVKVGQVMMALRYVITGVKVGAGIADTMAVIGREECLQRMEGILKPLSTGKL